MNHRMAIFEKGMGPDILKKVIRIDHSLPIAGNDLPQRIG